MSKEFGNRVQARKDKDLSREELAKLIGTSGPIIGTLRTWRYDAVR